ncbi:hypothetical protein LJC11_00475 [Bacteroidales bacterium OttesenSCG-928-I21]|nr:hypothetical protein [Bacteroidales bacterium OttesenSCG-928-I21]
MKASLKKIDEIFEFKGIWDMPSKCGLKIISQNNKNIIIVSELYQANPGTSITQASCLLAKQICSHYNIPMTEMTYIEHNPDMNSKLSFYDEEFYHVTFEIEDKNFINPKWKQLTPEEIMDFLE